jgi:hypothetical protein
MDIRPQSLILSISTRIHGTKLIWGCLTENSYLQDQEEGGGNTIYKKDIRKARCGVGCRGSCLMATEVLSIQKLPRLNSLFRQLINFFYHVRSQSYCS